MRSRTVSVVVCSPPYWPVKRWYGGEGIGFEPTLTEYVASLVAIFREARRVLKDDGVLWIVVADSYATRGGKWKADSYQADRPNHKERMPDGTHYPATGRSPGDLLMIPARLAMALQDELLDTEARNHLEQSVVAPGIGQGSCDANARDDLHVREAQALFL